MSYSTTAASVINAVIQDGQVQTTNRIALLDYVNRVSQRMLRESQWLFLRSQEQRFMTQPDAAKYWLGPGIPSPGCVSTGLDLSDVASIVPDSVYDLSNGRRLTQDSQAVLTGPVLRFKDGTYRSSLPRTYRYDYNVANVLHLYPPPDNQNSYQPQPTSPVCNWVAGGMIAFERSYYILVTLVDSAGNESVPCAQYSNIVVPGMALLTVDGPHLDVASATTVNYNFYNVYVSQTSNGDFFKQNLFPLPISSTWTEPTIGISDMMLPPLFYPILAITGEAFNLGVDTGGHLTTTEIVTGGTINPIPLKDGNGVVWNNFVISNGLFTSISTNQGEGLYLVLRDTDGIAWHITVNTSGNMLAISLGPAVDNLIQALTPPQTSNIIPLEGYVISFFYQKQRVIINDPSQILQIPDNYADVVIAGVNYYSSLYTAKSDDLNVKLVVWKKEFMDGLAQMRRDLRINFRNTDVIMPDGLSQYEIGTQAGYSYEVQQ